LEDIELEDLVMCPFCGRRWIPGQVLFDEENGVFLVRCFCEKEFVVDTKPYSDEEAEVDL
jgi:hypothetical protein